MLKNVPEELQKAIDVYNASKTAENKKKLDAALKKENNAIVKTVNTEIIERLAGCANDEDFSKILDEVINQTFTIFKLVTEPETGNIHADLKTVAPSFWKIEKQYKEKHRTQFLLLKKCTIDKINRLYVDIINRESSDFNSKNVFKLTDDKAITTAVKSNNQLCKDITEIYTLIGFKSVICRNCDVRFLLKQFSKCSISGNKAKFKACKPSAVIGLLQVMLYHSINRIGYDTVSKNNAVEKTEKQRTIK